MTNKSVFTYIHDNKEYKVTSPLIGKYNIYNLLLAIVVLEQMNIDIKDIIKVSETISCPPGRMDIIKYKTQNKRK